jgi:predicted nucleotidyltransferase
VRKSEIDILIEEARKEEKYFKNYLDYAKRIKKEAERLLGKVKVYVFGSILRKNEVPMDIDILIISQKLKTAAKKSKIMVELQRKLRGLGPFEIHLITPKEYKDWYKNFIREKKEIK